MPFSSKGDRSLEFSQWLSNFYPQVSQTIRKGWEKGFNQKMLIPPIRLFFGDPKSNQKYTFDPSTFPIYNPNPDDLVVDSEDITPGPVSSSSVSSTSNPSTTTTTTSSPSTSSTSSSSSTTVTTTTTTSTSGTATTTSSATSTTSSLSSSDGGGTTSSTTSTSSSSSSSSTSSTSSSTTSSSSSSTSTSSSSSTSMTSTSSSYEPSDDCTLCDNPVLGCGTGFSCLRPADSTIVTVPWSWADCFAPEVLEARGDFSYGSDGAPIPGTCTTETGCPLFVLDGEGNILASLCSCAVCVGCDWGCSPYPPTPPFCWACTLQIGCCYQYVNDLASCYSIGTQYDTYLEPSDPLACPQPCDPVP